MRMMKTYHCWGKLAGSVIGIASTTHKHPPPHTHTHTHARIQYTNIHTDALTYIHTHTPTYVHAHTCAHTHKLVHVSVQVTLAEVSKKGGPERTHTISGFKFLVPTPDSPWKKEAAVTLLCEEAQVRGGRVWPGVSSYRCEFIQVRLHTGVNSYRCEFIQVRVHIGVSSYESKFIQV